jgi:hypothetical protein
MRISSLMGVDSSELFKVISEEAPDSIKAGEIKNHFGRKVAIVSYLWWMRLQPYLLIV